VLEEREAISELRLEIEGASWLSSSALMLIGATAGAPPSDLEASVVDATRTTRLQVRLLGFGPRRPEDRSSVVLVLTLPQLELALGGEAALVVQAEGVELRLAAEDLKPRLDDVAPAAHQRIASLAANDRESLFEFLAATIDAVPKAERRALSEQLFGFRETLRERLQRHVVTENPSFRLHVDRILPVDDRSFYIQGWIHDEDVETIRVTAVSPEGSRAELLERMFRYPRPDVAEHFSRPSRRVSPKHGFICFVELDASSLLPDGWLFELGTATGIEVEVPGPSIEEDEMIAVRDAILKDPFYERMPNDELMAKHVHPAISRLEQAVEAEPGFEEVVQFGTPPDSPEVSIVVPIYEQLDHLEMQLAEFVHDPEISAADLIYVLDSPEQSDELLELAAQLTPLYRVPFRVGILEHNAGFARANNAGASLARGRLLLLLNSDILPDKPGWLSKMQQFYDSTPNIGALGPKLLYEDDSIQHAGMYYYQQPGSSVWIDAHYFKGMHRSLPAAGIARPVPLVSGACLMIDRSLYEELGGLHGIYVRGDYEDMELCLRLSEQGRENWYLPDAELYHLEAQSYSGSFRRAANRYNMWLHTHLLGNRIASLMKGT
jgi:GT2 family glycosyltransferase